MGSFLADCLCDPERSVGRQCHAGLRSCSSNKQTRCDPGLGQTVGTREKPVHCRLSESDDQFGTAVAV